MLFAIPWEFVSEAPTVGVAYVMPQLNAFALGVQSAAVLRFGISGLSTTYLTGTLTRFIARAPKRKEPFQSRSILILLDLLGGAAAGAVVALHARRATSIYPLVIWAIVVTFAEISFHRQIRR